MISTEEQTRKRIDMAVKECEEHKEISYWLRLVVANFLDGDGRNNTARKTDGKWADVEIRHWEEGRSNPIANNTHVTVERLMANKPDFTWTGIPSASGRSDLLAATRKAYYTWIWDRHKLDEQYGLKLLDLVTLGEANMGCFVRGDGVEPEWCDALNVSWDPAYKDSHKRRYVVYEKSLTLGEAIKFYPAIGKMERYDVNATHDKLVWVTCFWDRDNQTEAVRYKGQFIHGPTASRYGDVLPIRASKLAQLPSVKQATGIVERQMGSHELKLRLRRYFRDTALKAMAVGVAAGNFNEDQLKRLEDGEDVILRGSPGAQFNYAKGAEIQSTAIQVDQMVTSDLQAESGINEFSLNQTNSNVDFASQLGYLAQQGSSRDRFLSMKVEVGVKDDMLELIMPIASRFEARSMTFEVNGVPQAFGHFGQDELGRPRVPINPLLGSDGTVKMRPGGMVFKSSAQALQEDMILAQMLGLAATVPPGMAEPYLRRVLKDAEVEEPDKWIQMWQEAQAEIAMQEQAMMEQQMMMAASQPQQGAGQKQPAQRT